MHHSDHNTPVPELPDVTIYIETLRERLLRQPLDRVVLRSPFILRSVEPPISAAEGQPVLAIRRLGKRIVFQFPDELFLVVHLMIAGRLRWRQPDAKPGIGAKIIAAEMLFPHGRLLLTEAGTRKRASITMVRWEQALAAIDRGGVEPLEATPEAFTEALTRENHTLKRTLTDPRLFSGIGNAYSDEILHAAQLSPLKLSRSLTDAERTRLYAATQTTLREWIERLRVRAGGEVPEKVTAFHPDMAVHGRFNLPCPVCGTPVQRIVYADNECNYCARCQTGGKLLADRSLSRLLKSDWPRSIDDL